MTKKWKKPTTVCEKRGHHEYPIHAKTKNRRSHELLRICWHCGFTIQPVEEGA